MPEEFFDEIISCLAGEAKRRHAVRLDSQVEQAFFAAPERTEPRPRARPQPPQQQPQQRPAPAPIPVPAGRDAVKVGDLDFGALAQAVAGCRECRLCENRTNTVFGEGDPGARLMFIGEGPGNDEDLQGRPFVGEAGQLLTRMIQAMQFAREEVYIANIVKCRPPRNRNPQDDEAAACLKYLRRQIELIKPEVIVVLGSVPLRFLLETDGITRNRGRWFDYRGIPAMPTFHPAYLLRDPSQKRLAWEDLQQVMARFGKNHQGKQA